MKILFILCMIFSLCYAQDKVIPPSIKNIVEKELEFAKESSIIGARAGFSKHFSEDGIIFSPHPQKLSKALKNDTSKLKLEGLTLVWRPIYADVSFGEDIGFTTGPCYLRKKSDSTQRIWYGYFLSIWKKQNDGIWKVLIDFGIDGNNVNYDEELTVDNFKPIKNISMTNISKLLKENNEIKINKMKTDFYKNCIILNGISKEKSSLNDLKKFIKTNKIYLNLIPIEGNISRSNDLAYSYGKVEFISKLQKEYGYYLRVFRCLGKGKWITTALVFDKLNN